MTAFFSYYTNKYFIVYFKQKGDALEGQRFSLSIRMRQTLFYCFAGFLFQFFILLF